MKGAAEDIIIILVVAIKYHQSAHTALCMSHMYCTVFVPYVSPCFATEQLEHAAQDAQRKKAY